ncbi:phosphoribosyl-AMP cyclohydrolase [Bradyrhizobium sp. GM22.5]
MSAHSHETEEGLAFLPRFDAAGLVTVVATEFATGDVLMVAHMNDEALRKTIATGEAWYFSRSRNALWRKGETSGQTQRVLEIRTDCDQDAVWLRVEQIGAACHTGRRSCFYRKVEAEDGGDQARLCRCGQAVRSGRGVQEVVLPSCGGRGWRPEFTPH